MRCVRVQHRLRASAPLLHHVRKLMCQQPLPGPGLRPELVGAEHDVIAVGVGIRMQVCRAGMSLRVVVDTHAAEIGVESHLHRFTYPNRQRGARAQHSHRGRTVAGSRLQCH